MEKVKIAAVILGIIILMFGIWFGIQLFRQETASFRGGVDAEVTIESAPSRIGNYNHFFDLCASIEGYEDQILVLEDQLTITDSEDQKEVNRLNQTISGLKGQRARAIRQYNADSQKDYTQARFKSSDLPWSLDPEERTVCNATYND